MSKSTSMNRKSSTMSSSKTCKSRRSGGLTSKSSLTTVFEGVIHNLFKNYYSNGLCNEPIPIICTEDQIDLLFYISDPKVIFVGKTPLASETVETAIYRNYPINHTTLNAITGCMEEYKTLTVLRLEFCNLTSEHVSRLAKNLCNTYITDLSLNGNTMDDEQNFYLLLEQTRLKSLSLKYCLMNSEGMSKIADKLLKPLGSLLVLNLASNIIYDEGAEHVARMLRSNRTLLSLNLADNKITDKGCRSIMQSLVEFELLPNEFYFKRKRNFEKLKNALNTNLNASKEVLPDPPIAAKKSSSKGLVKEKSSGSLAKKKSSSKSKGKSATSAASQASGSQNSILDPDYHPFIDDVKEDQQTSWCKGNDILINLNLSYNNIHKEGAKAILDALYHQQRLFAKDKGLSRVTTDGNNFHSYCSFEINEIQEMLTQKARKLRGSVRSGSLQKKSGSRLSLLPQIKT